MLEMKNYKTHSIFNDELGLRIVWNKSLFIIKLLELLMVIQECWRSY